MVKKIVKFFIATSLISEIEKTFNTLYALGEAQYSGKK
jgi:hypothetical protein